MIYYNQCVETFWEGIYVRVYLYLYR